MTDLIQRLAAAIFRQEGMADNWPNPGNLRDCPWYPVSRNTLGVWPDGYVKRVHADGTPVLRQQLGSSGWFWVPGSRQEGEAGAMHVIALHMAEGNNLEELISIWAPIKDNNNTAAYITNVSNWATIPDTKVPLWTLL